MIDHATMSFSEPTATQPPAPDFCLNDSEYNWRDLDSVMGDNGVLIGFIRDTWQPESIRRILFMQKYYHKFQAEGYNVCLIIADQPHTLHSFYLSSGVKMNVPLLADEAGAVHDAYNIDKPCLLVVDRDRRIRQNWQARPTHVWMRPSQIVENLHALH